jgi:hypothetical protein
VRLPASEEGEPIVGRPLAECLLRSLAEDSLDHRSPPWCEVLQQQSCVRVAEHGGAVGEQGTIPLAEPGQC